MSGQGTEASSTPGTCRTSQLSELLVGAVAMRLGFSARFIAYEASSHRTSPRGSSWVQALPGKFRGNHNPGFDRGNFCPFPGAYLGSHTPGIPGISGSTWEHTHPGAYSGRETRVFPGGRWEPRSQPRSWPRKNPGTGWIPGFSRVVLLSSLV